MTLAGCIRDADWCRGSGFRWCAVVVIFHKYSLLKMDVWWLDSRTPSGMRVKLRVQSQWDCVASQAIGQQPCRSAPAEEAFGDRPVGHSPEGDGWRFYRLPPHGFRCGSPAHGLENP